MDVFYLIFLALMMFLKKWSIELRSYVTEQKCAFVIIAYEKGFARIIYHKENPSLCSSYMKIFTILNYCEKQLE